MRHLAYWTVLIIGSVISLIAYGKRIEHNYGQRIGH